MTADVIANGLGEFLHDVERAATKALLGQISKPAFDPIEPGTGRGRKVQVKARVATQPTLNPGMLMGAVIVDDQVQVQLARSASEISILEFPFLRPWVFGSRILSL